MMRKLLLLLLALALSGVLQLSAEEPLDISMINLVAAPQQFDGKLVRVRGYLNIEFENIELYLHKEDCVQGLTKNGVWLDLNKDARKKFDSSKLHYVFVEGVVDSSHFGHMGATSATLTKIQRIERLR